MAEDERIEEEERRLICMKCMAVIPSDEDEAIEHIVEAHGVSWGQYTRNIARLYFIEFEELDVTDILKFPVFNRWDWRNEEILTWKDVKRIVRNERRRKKK